MWRCCILLLAVGARGKLDSEPEDDETRESGDHGHVGPDEVDSTEQIGASVTQISRFPFAASLLLNNTYICSAVILNTYWLTTDSKCFATNVISSYVTHRNLKNFTIRVGSSYNNKGGSLFKITTLINNFDLKISAVKLSSPMEYDDNVQAAKLPAYDEEVKLGYLASIIAWTPVGHMRTVNAPLIEASICDAYTKLIPGYYICVGGVQDINRKFCRKDNGGAVVQNNTLIGVTTFLHECAVYTRTHAFPKVSSFARWLDSVIWDEGNRPTTARPVVTQAATTQATNATDSPNENTPFFLNPNKYMITLPFMPINVPLEPTGDNSVLPKISLYESYLQNIARSKISTTVEPKPQEDQKRGEVNRGWVKKYGNALMMMPAEMYNGKRYRVNDYKNLNRL